MIAISWVLLAILLTSLAYMVAVRGLFFLVLISSVVSIVSVLFYLSASAPDIGLTEMSISACMSTIFYIFFLIYISSQKSIERKIIDKPIRRNFFFLIIIPPMVFVFYKIFYLLPRISYFYNINVSGSLYLKNSFKDFGIESVVTTIVAGYRALDTFFETVVILTTSFILKNIFSSKQD